MKNYSKKARNMLLFISIGAFLASIGLYVYMYHKTALLGDKVLAVRETIATEEKGQSASKNLLALSDSTAEARGKLPSFFVPADDAVAFIQAIESVGNVTGAPISISSITSDNTERSTPGTVGKISAQVSTTGSWQAVMRSLELVESLPYKSDINHVTMSIVDIVDDKGTGSRSAWVLTFDVTALTLARAKLTEPSDTI